MTQDHPTTEEKHDEHDAGHHKSLRLALGSILAPKRPSTPSSHSTSGTASPAHPSTFASPVSPGLPPPPPHSTPVHHPDHPFQQPRGIHIPHTPSRLAHSDHMWPASSPASAPYSPHTSSAQTPSPADECPPVLALPPSVAHSDPRTRLANSLHAPKPRNVPESGPVPPARTASGSGTPRTKFMETLESKSAWDALIHGSFS